LRKRSVRRYAKRGVPKTRSARKNVTADKWRHNDAHPFIFQTRNRDPYQSGFGKKWQVEPKTSAHYLSSQHAARKSFPLSPSMRQFLGNTLCRNVNKQIRILPDLV
jgi:hypothetical protein